MNVNNEQDTAFDDLLRTLVLADPVDSTPVDQRVRASIRAEKRRASRRWVLSATGLAAVLLVGVVSYRTVLSTRSQSLYAAAARDHHVEIVDRQPRKWVTDRASIAGLLERQGLSRAVFGFAPVGYRLAQGRLCFLDGRVFLHLVYTNDAGNFSLFLRRPDSAGTTPVHLDTFATERVAGFQYRQLTALIVTAQPGDAALHLAQSAAEAL